MNIREIKTPITAATLNESLAKRYGTKIDISKFTLPQLEDARNKIRTMLKDIETNESFDAVKSESYQKSKLFLDVLNQAIKEAPAIVEGEGKMPSKADVMKCCKDGMTVAEICKKYPDCDQDKLKALCKECKDELKESVIKEGAEDNAELVMASKDMVDRVTGWMEDTAEMQTESMLELADAIRDEMGAEKSEAFTNAVKPALEAMYTAMESTREALTNGVGIVTGEGEPMDAMGAEDPEADPAMEPTVDAEEPAVDPETGEAADDFGADAAATGGDAEAGRETRESVARSRKIGTLLAGKKS